MAKSPRTEAAESGTGKAAETTVIELAEPVQFGSERIERITLQKITGAAMRHVPLPTTNNPAPDYYLEIASRVSGYPPPVFDLLAVQDVLAVVHAVANLVSPSAGTTDRATRRSR